MFVTKRSVFAVVVLCTLLDARNATPVDVSNSNSSISESFPLRPGVNATNGGCPYLSGNESAARPTMSEANAPIEGLPAIFQLGQPQPSTLPDTAQQFVSTESTTSMFRFTGIDVTPMPVPEELDESDASNIVRDVPDMPPSNETDPDELRIEITTIEPYVNHSTNSHFVRTTCKLGISEDGMEMILAMNNTLFMDYACEVWYCNNYTDIERYTCADMRFNKEYPPHTSWFRKLMLGRECRKWLCFDDQGVSTVEK